MPNPPLAPDEGVVLHLSDPQNLGNNGFQHVIYSDLNGFFENASMCTYLNNERYEGVNRILIKAHTSALPLYLVTIYLHNHYDTAVPYQGRITDVRDGKQIGRLPLQNIPGNSSYESPFAFFDQTLGWTPRSDQESVNLFFNTTTLGFYATAGQMVVNTRLSTYVNMTHFCAINHLSTSQ